MLFTSALLLCSILLMRATVEADTGISLSNLNTQKKMVAECIGWIFSFGHKRASDNSFVAYFSTFESHQKKRAAAHTQ